MAKKHYLQQSKYGKSSEKIMFNDNMSNSRDCQVRCAKLFRNLAYH